MKHEFQKPLDWIASQQKSMVETLIGLAEINSGSLNLAGLSAMKLALEDLFGDLDAPSQSIALPELEAVDQNGNTYQQSVGQALTLNKHPQAPLQVLLMGHMDTVFGADHPFQGCRWQDNNMLNGPGVADLKGGLVIMHSALKALENSSWAGKIGWQILINPDEEIGSLSSSELISSTAQNHHLGMVFEPSLPDGTLAGARKGSGNFTAVATGKAAHAGREHHLGRNAIRALSEFTLALDGLNGQVQGITVNPGFIHGGGPVNIVPYKAVMKFNVRISQSDHEPWFWQQIDRILAQVNAADGISIELHGGFGRKPKPLDKGTLNLFELIRRAGDHLDIDINWKDTGGCCDGNNLAAAGLANVDTLGAVGGSIHSEDEYIDVDSLTQRAQLSALLLMQLASGETQWPTGRA